MTTHTRTFVNANGLPVLERRIREGLHTFDMEPTDPELKLTPEERLIRYVRTTGRAVPPTETQIMPAIFAAEDLLRKQRYEDQWRSRIHLYFDRYVSTEEYVEMSMTKGREKRERIEDVRCLLIALMGSDIDAWNMKNVYAILGETFILEEDYESAYFWLSMADSGTCLCTRRNLDKAVVKLVDIRKRGEAPLIDMTPNGLRYRPLKEWEKERRRKSVSKGN